jgi:adenylate cyclase
LPYLRNWSTDVIARFSGATGRVIEPLRSSGLGQWLAKGFGWFIALGTAGYPQEVQRRLRILNMIAALIAMTTGVYAIQQTSLDFATYRPIIIINVLLFIMALMLPVLHRFGPIVAAITLVGCEYAAMIALSAYMGRNTGLHMQLFVTAAATFVVLGLERLRLILLVTAAGLAVHLLIWFRFPQEVALLQIDQGMIDGIYVQAAVTTCGLIAATVWYAFRLVEEARRQTDTLLRKILPDSVVDRLKSRPAESIADAFEDVSVMFADISGFVPLSRALGATRVVSLLNELVSEFDRIAAAHGVEKIKTIGDAYMAASGVPMRSPDHLQRLVRVADEMLDAVAKLRARTGLQVHMRIGIAAGPVMAGVIGSNKFSYDVWGDTVNLAARLESLSTPGRILVCPSCRTRLEADYELASLGRIEIKGIGECETWLIANRKSAPGPIGTGASGQA